MARVALLSAAWRHVRDAEHLLRPGQHRSLDQALHLAGFGPECARKACVDEVIADKALGHDFKAASDVVLEVLIALDPSASRYGLRHLAATLPFRAQHWHVNCRYDATGAAREVDVRAVVEEARRFVDARASELWCDGTLPIEVFS